MLGWFHIHKSETGTYYSNKREEKNTCIYRYIETYLTELRPNNKVNKEISSRRTYLYIRKRTVRKLICNVMLNGENGVPDTYWTSFIRAAGDCAFILIQATHLQHGQECSHSTTKPEPSKAWNRVFYLVLKEGLSYHIQIDNLPCIK